MKLEICRDFVFVRASRERDREGKEETESQDTPPILKSANGYWFWTSFPARNHAQNSAPLSGRGWEGVVCKCDRHCCDMGLLGFFNVVYVFYFYTLG